MRKSFRYPIGPAERLGNLSFPNPEPLTVIDRHRAYVQSSRVIAIDLRNQSTAAAGFNRLWTCPMFE